MARWCSFFLFFLCFLLFSSQSSILPQILGWVLLYLPLTDVEISPEQDSNLTKATQLTVNWGNRARPQGLLSWNLKGVPIRLLSTQEGPDYPERWWPGGEDEDEGAPGGAPWDALGGRCVCHARAEQEATVCFFLNSMGIGFICYYN